MSKISIINLSHSYLSSDNTQLDVLKNINLEIEEKDFIVLLGESGCGKTTFLNILAGLVQPMVGTLLIDDKIIQGPQYTRSFIFQQPSLLPWLTVKDNIAFGCKLRNDTLDLSKRVNKFIKLMGLKEFENVYPSGLSLGMSQRVAFARALINQPEILLLDEPFTSLDFINRARLQEELLKTWTHQKYTIIFVTHDIDEATLLGNKIVLLSNRPTSIKKIIKIDYPYPRDLSEKKFYDIKLEIQKEFKQLLKN